jgi:hypothetical protein
MERLEKYVAGGVGVLESVSWVGDENERRDLIKWAYTEADLLLRENKAAIRDVSNCLTGGAATVGDCIAVIERW